MDGIQSYWGEIEALSLEAGVPTSAITLALHPLGDIKKMSNETILTVTGAILLLAIAALIQQFGSARFSWEEKDF